MFELKKYGERMGGQRWGGVDILNMMVRGKLEKVWSEYSFEGGECESYWGRVLQVRREFQGHGRALRYESACLRTPRRSGWLKGVSKGDKSRRWKQRRNGVPDELGLVHHCKASGFHSEWSGKPLRGSEKKSDTIWGPFERLKQAALRIGCRRAQERQEKQCKRLLQ